MQSGSVLLETALPDRENSKTLFFTEPHTELVAYEPSEIDDVLTRFDEWVARGHYVAGYMDYEAGFAFESVGTIDRSTEPIAWFGVYRNPVDFEGAMTEGTGLSDSEIRLEPRFSYSSAAYDRRIRSIKAHLLEGNVYQINLTGCFDFELEDDPFVLYRQLRSRQPAGYNAFLNGGGRTILSCSPELFFRRDGDRIWTRPMKGTVRRGSHPDEDTVLSRWLRSDEKTQAENLMIVDLIRNDLSRICRFGSIHVPEMFTPELYRTVIQLTSTVEGRLKPETAYRDVFRALFPCGSVTGAPKVSAMKIIHDLEGRRRGIYTGAIGYAGPGDQAVFSVAIRTVKIAGSQGQMGSGGGIVWDSVADAEYRECLLKAAFLTGEPGRPDLIETILWDGEYRALDRHLGRLARSAGELSYQIDSEEIIRRLGREAEPFDSGWFRVRLMLRADGEVSITSRKIPGASIPSGTVRISAIRTDPGDPWLYHKSTRREIYDAEFSSAISEGHVEVLFLNKFDEITEGSRSNVFIRRGDRLLTPPVSCGLLPGTRRAAILDTNPRAAESPIRLADLLAADEVLVCNATTPLTPVVPTYNESE